MSVGPSTAVPRPGSTVRPAKTGAAKEPVRTRTLGVILLAALLASPALAGDVETVRTPGPKDQYRRIIEAWAGRSAAGVIAHVPARGTLSLYLLSPRVSGTYRRAQAKHTLQRYFERVSDIRLVDVTPKEIRTPRGWAVRIYKYTYLPQGRDRVTTRLTITMKGNGRGAWYLNSIRETPER